MRKLDRRTMLGLGGAAAGGLLLAGRSGRASTGGHFAVVHSDVDWRRILSPQRYSVLREAGTERAFTSPLLNEHRKGLFTCAGCDFPCSVPRPSSRAAPAGRAFGSPSGAIVTRQDRSLLMERTEVLCARCGGHLGHVFEDGPKPTGLRYCMNGVALQFRLA